MTSENIHDVGELLDNQFEVIKVMHGGMGQVFVCKDHFSSTKDFVVLKTFNIDIASKDYPICRDRFIKEGEAWFKIGRSHAEVDSFYVGLHGTKIINGRPYLVMSYCPGGNLRERMAPGQLQTKDIISIATQILLGLHIINDENGLIHRDIKPENVLFTKFGHAAVSDLGIAKFIEESQLAPKLINKNTKLTQYGSFIGTIPYAAPEQLAGLGGINQGVDIWAFGILLYEMIIGYVPFRGASIEEQVHNILYKPVPNIDKIESCCGNTVATIIKKCLDKNCSKRYSSFNELIKAWDKVIRFESSPKVARIFRKDSRLLIEDKVIERVFLKFFPERKSNKIEHITNHSALNRCEEAADLLRIGKSVAALGSCKIVLDTLINGKTNLERLLNQELDETVHIIEWKEECKNGVIKKYVIPPKSIAEKSLYILMCCYVNRIETINNDVTKVIEKNHLLSEFITLCRKIIDAKCLSEEIMIMCAEGLLLGGMHNHALDLLSALHKNSPENDKISNVYWITAVDSLPRESLIALAENLLQNHVRRESFLSKMLCARISGYFRDYPMIESMTRGALVFDPTNLHAMHMLTAALLNQSKYEDARVVFNEMYRLDPNEMLTKKTEAFFR